MSEALFLGLPRFDSDIAPAQPQPATTWQKPLEDDTPDPDELISEPEPVETEPPEIQPQQIDLTQIEQSLAALSDRLSKMERDAQAQALQSVQSLAAKLFPALSQQFLADEISRHLARLIPASAAVVEVRAEEVLAAQLRARIDEIPALANRCTVTPMPAAGSGGAEVSWQSGGLSFDFDGLLAACLSHLNSRPSN